MTLTASSAIPHALWASVEENASTVEVAVVFAASIWIVAVFQPIAWNEFVSENVKEPMF